MSQCMRFIQRHGDTQVMGHKPKAGMMPSVSVCCFYVKAKSWRLSINMRICDIINCISINKIRFFKWSAKGNGWRGAKGESLDRIFQFSVKPEQMQEHGHKGQNTGWSGNWCDDRHYESHQETKAHSLGCCIVSVRWGPGHGSERKSVLGQASHT